LKLKRYGLWSIVLVSLVWSLANLNQFSQIKQQLSNIEIFAITIVISEVCFIGGLGLVAFGTGQSVFAGTGFNPIKWFGALFNLRRLSKGLLHGVSGNVFGRFGFYLNWVGAVGTTATLLIGALWFLPGVSRIIAVLLIADLAATFGWRVPLQRKLQEAALTPQIKVRLADQSDLDRYIKIQEHSWEDGLEVSHDRARSRFLVNRGGILVAEYQGTVVGTITTIRINNYDFDHPMTWNQVTGNGYCRTHQPEGKICYGVDLSVDHTLAPPGTVDALFVACMQYVIDLGVKYFVLGGRMPGYHEYTEHFTPEDYLFRKVNGKYMDRQVQMYSEVPLMKVLRVIPDYFEDPASLNYGVLLRWRNPMYGLPGRHLVAAFAGWLYAQYLSWDNQRQAKGRSQDRPSSFIWDSSITLML
jgi:hypothetical protein